MKYAHEKYGLKTVRMQKEMKAPWRWGGGFDARHMKKHHSTIKMRTPKLRFVALLFLLYFVLYAVTPLKASLDGTREGYIFTENFLSFHLMAVEQCLTKIDDLLAVDMEDSAEDGSVELMIKKKRMLISVITFLLLLLIFIAAHNRLFFSIALTDFMLPLKWFKRFFEQVRFFRISEVYRLPHSGLAPPSPHIS